MSLYFTIPTGYVEAYAARMIERGETPLDGERCEWCGAEVEDVERYCTDECDCPRCEVGRALDDDADMSREMIEP